MTGLDFNSFSPRHTFKLWSHYTRGAGSALLGAKLGAGVRYYSESQLGVAAPFVFTARQGGYFVADARLGYQLNRQTEVSVSVSNLFDKHYVTSPGIRAFYGEPRRVMLKASYTW